MITVKDKPYFLVFWGKKVKNRTFIRLTMLCAEFDLQAFVCFRFFISMQSVYSSLNSLFSGG